MILLVDDNPHNLKVLGNALMEEGYRLRLAKNGSQALATLKNHLPDLVLLDIMMPEMDGFEVCKEMKQNPKMKNIPIIFLTAKIEKDNIIHGLELGAVDYITKPFNQKELITRVRTHLKLQKVEAELREALATKDKFFSIIAHDLGNLFNALLGFSDLLSSKNVRKDEVDLFIPLIKQSSENGYNLLQNLLEWSRVQTGKIKVTPVYFEIKSLVQKNIDLFQGQAQKKTITLFSSLEEKNVFADINMINTVFRNLLANAIKFTPENGQIEVFSLCKPEVLEISIKDSGVGIKSQDIEKLFKLDENHTTPGTNHESGTGLGLVLCKEFIEKNEGTISVTSQEGKGSQFSICLPIMKKKIN